MSTPIKKGALCPKVHEEEASTHCAVAFVTLEHAESSFFSFVDEHQEEHRQLHPGAKDDDIAELLRVAGNTLSADEQVEYDDRVTEMRSLLFCNLDVAVSLRLVLMCNYVPHRKQSGNQGASLRSPSAISTRRGLLLKVFPRVLQSAKAYSFLVDHQSRWRKLRRKELATPRVTFCS